MNRSLRRLVIAALAMILLALSSCSSCGRRLAPPTGKLVIHFLDVGQGDSELIQLPNGHAILIDSGDRGAPTVQLMKSYNVGAVDLIIATHPHSDHIGEMRDVLREFKVAEFWDSGFVNPTKTYTDLLQDIRDRGITFRTPKRGEIRSFGDATLDVLSPGETFIDDSPNNASIVVRLSYRNMRFLFTGDAELPAWQKMIDLHEDLRADLLKAAHHGSSNGTSEAVVEAVRPSVVTISCASGNDYHHPHPKTVRLLSEKRNEIKTYRTDLEGTITATSDGNSIELATDKQVAQDRLYLTGDEVAGNVRGARASEQGRTRVRRAR